MKKHEVIALLSRTMQQVHREDPTIRALEELKRIVTTGELSPSIRSTTRRREARKQNGKRRVVARPRLLLPHTYRRKTA